MAKGRCAILCSWNIRVDLDHAAFKRLWKDIPASAVDGAQPKASVQATSQGPRALPLPGPPSGRTRTRPGRGSASVCRHARCLCFSARQALLLRLGFAREWCRVFDYSKPVGRARSAPRRSRDVKPAAPPQRHGGAGAMAALYDRYADIFTQRGLPLRARARRGAVVTAARGMGVVLPETGRGPPGLRDAARPDAGAPRAVLARVGLPAPRQRCRG